MSRYKVDFLKESNLWIPFTLVFILVSFYLLPSFNIFRSDDFGYYDSLVKSLQLGRIVRSEWLEPLNIGLTSSSFLLYKLTGNFYWSTLGLVLLLTTVNFLIIYWLLKDKLTPFLSFSIAFLFCTFPVYINKSTEFSGTIFSFTIFLVAISVYRKNWIKLFYLTVLIGFANRQNAVMLLGLPFFDFLSALIEKKKFRYDLALYTIVFGAIAYLLTKTQNITYAQFHITDNLISNLDAVRSFNAILRLVTILVISIFLMQVFFTNSSLSLLKQNRAGYLPPVILSVLIILSFITNNGDLFTFNGPGLGSIAVKFRLNYLFYLFALLSAWLINYHASWNAIRNSPYSMAIAFQCILLSIKGVLWDYYFLEIQILLLLITLQGPIEISVKRLLLAFVLIVNISYGYLFKVYSDSVEVKTQAYESLLREGKIELNQLPNAPWAFVGWKLFDYFIENDGKTQFTALSKFLCYQNDGSISLLIKYPGINFVSAMINKGFTSDHNEILNSGTYKIGGVNCGYEIRKNAAFIISNPCENEGLNFSLDNNLASKPMPLNNNEWANYINRPL